jgi:hypothetical protein
MCPVVEARRLEARIYISVLCKCNPLQVLIIMYHWLLVLCLTIYYVLAKVVFFY